MICLEQKKTARVKKIKKKNTRKIKYVAQTTK